MHSEHSKKAILYLLGAGASKDDGAPLMNELLIEGFDELAGQDDLGRRGLGMVDDPDEIKVRYLRLAKFLDMKYPGCQVERGCQKILHELIGSPSEIRHAATAIDVEQCLGDLDAALSGNTPVAGCQTMQETSEFRQLLLYFIFRTLGLTELNEHRRYTEFVRARLLDSSILSVVLNLNYDTSLDRALVDATQWNPATGHRAGLRWTYFAPFDTDGIPHQDTTHDPRPVTTYHLKLHGSLNWLLCKQCGTGRFFWGVPYTIYKQLTEQRKPWFCSKCQSVFPVLDLWLAPPSPYKTFDHPDMQRCWAKAAEFLELADEVVIIGYSFRTGDEALRNLLRTALPRNEKRPPVTIVNPNEWDRRTALTALEGLVGQAEICNNFEEYLAGKSVPGNSVPGTAGTR